MTVRNRQLLDLARLAPCMLELGANGCGNFPSVPCHSDKLSHGRGAGHRSHDCLAIPGCPACHAVYTREHLGQAGYEEAWSQGMARYLVWLWEGAYLKVLGIK